MTALHPLLERVAPVEPSPYLMAAEKRMASGWRVWMTGLDGLPWAVSREGDERASLWADADDAKEEYLRLVAPVVP